MLNDLDSTRSTRGEDREGPFAKLRKEFEGESFSDETSGPDLTVMQENLEHRIDEEGGERFKQARRVSDRDKLAERGMRTTGTQGLACTAWAPWILLPTSSRPRIAVDRARKD